LFSASTDIAISGTSGISFIYVKAPHRKKKTKQIMKSSLYILPILLCYAGGTFSIIDFSCILIL